MLAVLGSLLPLAAAEADEASGTWTGNVEARFNYYLERSTRVYMPAARVNVETPIGLRVRASYAVDVISSASIGQGVEEDGVLTEWRHGIGQMAVGQTIDTGAAEVDVSVNGTYSTEPDYQSLIYGLASSVALFEKNTTFSLALTRVDDDVQNNRNPAFHGELSGTTLSVGFDQLLSPVLKFNLGYQLSFLDGFLSNPYRAALAGAPRPEFVPDERVRHNLEGTVAWYLPSSLTTFQLYMRTYFDDWDIQAQTPELRVYQQFGPDFVARLRYRFYTQTRAEFAPEEGQRGYPVGHVGYVTSDPKLMAMDSHQIGLRLEYRLGFLSNTAFRFADEAKLDISLDHQWCNSMFGDNWIATAGGRIPF